MRIAILTTDGRDLLRLYGDAQPSFGTAPEALLQGFAALPGVEVHVIACTRKPLPPTPKLAANVYFHTVLVPKIGWMRTGYQGCIRAVRRKLREIRPDIVHGQGTERDCAICAVWSGFPNVLTVHGNMRLIASVTQARAFSFPWLAAKLERLTLPRTDGIVCITNYTREAVAGLAQRTWVVPNAVDQTFFENGSPVKTEPPVILCVGHVCVRKNQNRFIQSLDGLASERRFRLVFLGAAAAGDPYAEEFRRLLATRPWCEHGGFANREQLKQWLRPATALVLPSLEDNCPMVVLEAMAMGVPVIAAKVGGLPDLVEEGRNGLFCDPLSDTSMREAVARLLADGELGTRLATEAKQRALTRFHPKVVAERHVEIYREVVKIRS